MERINVTQAFLPPLEEYQSYLEQIWQSKHLSNQGPLLKEFEQRAGEYLGLDNLQFVANGTLALQIALRALDITQGEIITTPFSFVATTSAILWERCTPVFVDIEPGSFNIDPDLIEAAITPQTRAILAVHVFGFPCDTDKIEAIANKHKVKVIYDGAHAFGATYQGKSLLSYGDITTCSFHATKPFHTIEGGAVIARTPELSKKVDLIKKFGYAGDDHLMLGINAKASEFNAAMGLCNLKYIDDIITSRQAVAAVYDEALARRVTIPQPGPELRRNYAYYPVVFDTEADLLEVIGKLAEQNIHARRYFYPSLNTVPYVPSQAGCPVSERIARTILCLPLYSDLSLEDAHRIAKVVAA
jgi:dTDP-4-amino-4,6-dideoxygalactose transaminase